MQTIYKYPLMLVDVQYIVMYKTAVCLAAQVQDGRIYMWAEIDTDQPLVEVKVHIVGTGQECPTKECWFDGDEQHYNLYVNTVQLSGFVWHIYVEI